MSRSRKIPEKHKGGIKSQHQRKNQPIMMYIILFVAVGIVMITLNQTRKKNDSLRKAGEYPKENTKSANQFNKEGELKFFSAEDLIAEIDIEIADDDYQTQQGLMYRRSMKENRGMLFIFEDEQERSFWMQNTYMSLDILYVATDKTIVSIIENTAPKSEESILSVYPAKYVVEVNAGFVARYQIKTGDKISFKRTY
ncbi:MAG: DUF192 domain-containing protein [Bacteroidetes bacterium]|jgi:uncharacterized protein|nr:DUF192 domain-containing protein [Bacteroidota bacterium]